MIHDVKQDLEFYPQLRERKNKNRYIARKLEKKFTTGVPERVMIDMVEKVLEWDRNWRYVLQNNPRLRGHDYDDKKKLEQSTKVDLGYQPGFKQITSDVTTKISLDDRSDTPIKETTKETDDLDDFVSEFKNLIDNF